MTDASDATPLTPAVPDAPAVPSSGYIPYTPPVRPTFTSTRRDLVFAPLFLIAALGGMNATLYGNFAIGYTLAFFTLLGLSYAYLAPRLRLTPLGVAYTLAAGAAAVVFSLYRDALMLFCLLVGSLGLLALGLAENAGLRRYSSRSFRAIGDALYTLFILPLTHVSDALPALLRATDETGTVRKRRMGGILAGLLCTVPFLCLILPLLVQSDAAFETMMSRTLLAHLGEALFTLITGGLLFGYLFSRNFAVSRHLGARTPYAPVKTGALDALPLNAFLCGLSLFYLLYLFSQLAYFFGGFAGALPDGYVLTSDYARRGFFEMSAVSFINLAILFGVTLLSRRTGGKPPRVTRLLSLFICLFSLVLIATALAKMVLYMQDFGLTRLRVLTSAFMVVLAVLFLVAIIRLFVARCPYMPMVVLTTAVLVLTLAFADVDTLVARYNTAAYLGGQLPNEDLSEFSDLSDSAVPFLIRLMTEAPDERVREQARCQLKQRTTAFYTVACDDGAATDSPDTSGKTELTDPDDAVPEEENGDTAYADERNDARSLLFSPLPRDFRAYNRATWRARALLDTYRADIYAGQTVTVLP